MTDRSPHTIEQRLVSSVWVHQRHITNKTFEEIRLDFFNQFNRTAPDRHVLIRWEKNAFQTGCVR